MGYSPFQKTLGEGLDEDDLGELIGRTAEGYYVEYKETFPANHKIAHSIASLANTYGGWYIIGVKTDENHFAKEICGFSPLDFPDPVGKVRDIVKTRIDPVPAFFPVPVRLHSGRLVLVVYVPSGQRTPFVTNDGRIYRRNHDSSDPVPETSRHTLDHLVEVGRSVDEQFARFCTRGDREPPRMSLEWHLGWANLFIRPDPAELIQRFDVTEPDGIDELLALSNRPILLGLGDATGNIPFNLAQPTYNSAILRQTSTRLPFDDGITVELTMFGAVSLNIPIVRYRMRSVHDAGRESPAQIGLSDAMQRDQSGRILDAPMFGIGELLANIVVLLSFYKAWLGDTEWIPGFRVAFSLRGVGRSVPFADVDGWANQVSQWGLPMLETDVQYPRRWEDAMVFPNLKEQPIWLPVFQELVRAVGLRPVVAHEALEMVFKHHTRRPPT